MAKGPKRGSKGRVKSSLGSLRLREFRLDALQLADYNPRTISDEALAGLTKSIERFGCVEPIIVNIRGGRNRIVGGHQRAKAMLALGQTTATCVTVSCTDAEERLLNVTLNNPHLQGQFTDSLAAMIEELRTQIGDETGIDLRILELQEEISNSRCPPSSEPTIPEHQYGIFVECDDETAQKEIFERLEKEGYTCRLLTL